MSHTLTTTIPTPDGLFTLVANDSGLLASGWTDDVASLLALVHPTLRPDPADVRAFAAGRTDHEIASAARAVDAYYAGELAAPGDITVVQQSGPFRMDAWAALRTVAPGTQLTYTEYAALSGRPAAVRAAAAACAMNAAALFVPCHRILRTDGSLGGFRYGLEIKQRLLKREGSPGELGTLF